ncbi:MAG: chromate transporter [Treponema sp.]
MKNIYAQLFLTFAKIGSFTFGGGIAMLPMLSTELVEKRKWITDDELLDYYAVGQSTPGIIAVNVATFSGYKKGGVFGGICATLGMIFPSVLIISILATLINSIDQFPLVQSALNGINVAVCALLCDASITFSKKSVKKAYQVVLLLISFALIYFFNIPSFVIILMAVFFGVIWYFIQKKINKSGEKNA